MAKSAPSSYAEFNQQNETAIREAREADRIEPRAAAVRYDPKKGLIIVDLRSGFAFGFPPERIAGLAGSSAKELSTVRVSPSGDGLHWEDLEVHVSLTGLMSEALNLREWAPRIMGQARSEAKARASRLNGSKGGRPHRVRKRGRKTKQ